MKKQKQVDGIKRVTVALGYSLFALLLLALVLSTILPFGSMLFNPATKHFTVAVILVSLVAGAVLPALISYFIGDRSTRSKSLIDHQFNGVLFGIAAYWVSYFFILINSSNIESLRKLFTEPLIPVISGWPILATILVMSAIAMRYASQRKRQASLLESRLYQLVLFGGIIAVLAYALIYSSRSGSDSFVASLLENLVTPIVFFGIACAALLGRGVKKSSRLTLAAIALSLSYIASSVDGQLFPDAAFSLYPFLPLAIGLVVLVMYLLLIRRTE